MMQSSKQHISNSFAQKTALEIGKKRRRPKQTGAKCSLQAKMKSPGIKGAFRGIRKHRKDIQKAFKAVPEA